MRVVAIAFFLSICGFGVLAQPEGYAEVPIRGTPANRSRGCYLEGGQYSHERVEAAIQKYPNCADELRPRLADAASGTLVRWSASSDCHMRVAIKVLRLDSEKKYKFILNTIYGGCRAGGSRTGWTMFEKMLPGYTLEYAHVMVDRIHGTVPEGFVFPKPPAPIFTEPISVREVDLKECLPLTQQSQWVLRGKEFVTRNFTDANRERCGGVLTDLNIDFEKETLVGYSFASGYCERPQNLRVSAARDTSSDPRLNRIRIQVGYDRPSTRCESWRTYPVWMIIPKVPTSPTISFENSPAGAPSN